MTEQHRRLRLIAACLTVLLFIAVLAIVSLSAMYYELEAEHLATYAAFETCDFELHESVQP